MLEITLLKKNLEFVNETIVQGFISFDVQNHGGKDVAAKISEFAITAVVPIKLPPQKLSRGS